MVKPIPSCLEICVDSLEGLQSAIEGGADRIELCSALAVGGLTPTPGLMAAAGRCDIPVYAMIRPHPGDFVFSAQDVESMYVDIDSARSVGLAGVVLGANRDDGTLDEDSLEALVQHAGGMGLTLHRAIDLVPDIDRAVQTAIALGFERILTSGGAKTALDGLDTLARMVELAGDRISIMPGAGITPANAAAILHRLEVVELHASASKVRQANQSKLIDLGFLPEGRKMTDADTVAALKAVMAAQINQ